VSADLFDSVRMHGMECCKIILFLFVRRCVTIYRSSVTSKLIDIRNNFEININNIVGTVIFVRNLFNTGSERECISSFSLGMYIVIFTISGNRLKLQIYITNFRKHFTYLVSFLGHFFFNFALLVFFQII
jgi:hypothetical protein